MEAVTSKEPRKRIKYFACDKPGTHQGEFLNLICIEASCPERGLICSICKAESHDKHRVIPLRMFLQEVLKCHKNAETSGIADVLSKLQDNKNSVLFSLQSTVEALAAAVRKSQQDIIEFYSSIQKDVLKKIKTNQDLNQMVTKILQCDFESDQQAKEQIKKIIENLKVDTGNQQSTQRASKSAWIQIPSWNSPNESIPASKAT